jgi:hypothetical protein
MLLPRPGSSSSSSKSVPRPTHSTQHAVLRCRPCNKATAALAEPRHSASSGPATTCCCCRTAQQHAAAGAAGAVDAGSYASWQLPAAAAQQVERAFLLLPLLRQQPRSNQRDERYGGLLALELDQLCCRSPCCAAWRDSLNSCSSTHV